jgi:hypothetical protein
MHEDHTNVRKQVKRTFERGTESFAPLGQGSYLAEFACIEGYNLARLAEVVQAENQSFGAFKGHGHILL